MKANPQAVVLGKCKNLREKIQSMSRRNVKLKLQYPSVTQCGGHSNKYRASLRISKPKYRPWTADWGKATHLRKALKKFKDSHKLRESTSLTRLKPKIRKIVTTWETEKMTEIVGCSQRGKTFLERRGGIFHDKMVHNFDHLGARTWRKLRLGVSRLRAQAYFMYPDKSPICTHCHHGVPETIQHFMMDCPRHDQARKTFFEIVKRNNELIDFEARTKTAFRLLGFLEEIKDPKVEASTRQLRYNLLTSCCNFLIESERFEDDH